MADDREGVASGQMEPQELLRFAERARSHGFVVDAIRLYQAEGGLTDEASRR